MCGIFGAIGVNKQWNLGIVQGLAWANRERGTHSAGFFDSSGRMIKRAGDPSDVLVDPAVREWLHNAYSSQFEPIDPATGSRIITNKETGKTRLASYAWAIGGHTRYATQGAINKRNAHPFRSGHIVGSHNGMVNAPAKFEVDSEYLFDKIFTDGYKGLESIGGYWGLAWYDTKEQHFYLTCHSNVLAYGVLDGAVYYSSDKSHLAGFIPGDIHEMKEGQVVRFDRFGNVVDSESGEIEAIDARKELWDSYHSYGGFTGGGGTKWKGRNRYTGGTVSTTGYGHDDADFDTATYTPKNRDSDFYGEGGEDFMEDWQNYFHSMNDEQYAAWENIKE